jgi:glyoxylase-like metal-dependent hydrolase (beta-lactamase superfamily II)
MESQSLLRQRILPDSQAAKLLKALYRNRRFPQPSIFPSHGGGKIAARRSENSANAHQISNFATCPCP